MLCGLTHSLNPIAPPGRKPRMEISYDIGGCLVRLVVTGNWLLLRYTRSRVHRVTFIGKLCQLLRQDSDRISVVVDADLRPVTIGCYLWVLRVCYISPPTSPILTCPTLPRPFHFTSTAPFTCTFKRRRLQRMRLTSQ